MARDARDRKFMEAALEEMLLSGSEHVDKPDPMVGAVLVDASGIEIARGHRSQYSPGDHGEFTILEKAAADRTAVGATLFVTLEPCVGHREPPKKSCAQRIFESGISRVVIGIKDPNPKIKGRGADYLRHRGIQTDFFDEDLAAEIIIHNRVFIEFMEANGREGEAPVAQVDRVESPCFEDHRPISNAGIDDFSKDAIRQYLKASGQSIRVPSRELWELFKKATFVRKQGNHFVPTLSGMVLFGKTPDVFLPEHRIRAYLFPGSPDDGISLERIVKSEDITGPLLDMVNSAVNFYENHVTRVPAVPAVRRVEGEIEYPVRVIREAVVNALVHRDYQIGGHVSFRMFRDQVSVISPGKLPSPNTLERVRSFDVTVVRRNRLIAAGADSLGLMEKEGFGIRNMPSHLRQYGLRPPDFDYDGAYFSVTFYGREKSSPIYRISPEQRSRLNQRQLDILNLIWQRGRITSKVCQEEQKITRETANQDFRRLISLGLVLRMGTGKGTYYVLAR